MFLQQRYFSYETKEATDFAVKDQDLLTPHLPQQSQLQLHMGDLGIDRQHLGGNNCRPAPNRELRQEPFGLAPCVSNSYSRAHACYHNML